MGELKITVITVAYNAGVTIERSIISVLEQQFSNIQYIIIDGGSTDGTLDIINRYREHIDIVVTEPDQGIYDAMNKGISLADGDIIGTINADDFLADEHVLGNIAEAFSKENTDILYGNLDFIDPNGKVVRRWRSGRYHRGMFNRGWMPPHPTFYCRKRLFDEHGAYSLEYGSAADYELMLRFIHAHKANVFHLDKIMVKMYIGGISNKNVGNRVKALCYDLKAMRKNGILFPYITIIFKPLRKILQFF